MQNIMKKKNSMKIRLAGLLFLGFAAVAAAYVLWGIQWPVGTDVGYTINPNTAQVGDEVNAVNNAAHSWSQINPPGLKMTYFGLTGVTDSSQDWENAICWKDSGNNGILGRTYAWSVGSTIVETDMVFNDHYAWSTSGADFDIQTVALHEFGHWVGLDHSPTGIMQAAYGGIQRSIDADARAGFEAMYGSAAPQPAIELDRTSVSFFGSEEKSFRIRNSGDGTLHYQVISDRGWLSVDPDSGDSGGEWDEIRMESQTAGLDPGRHGASVTISSGDASNSPRRVDVDLTVPNDSPPIISIISPTSGTVVTSPVTVKASASDDHGVTKVTFSVDGTVKKSIQNPPYNWTFNPNDYASGFYTVTARAYDTINQTADDTIRLKVDKPPTVMVTSPAAGADVSGIVPVSADAQDDFGVKKVVFYVNNAAQKTDNASPYTFDWNTSSLANGSYIVKAVVTDSIGQTAQNEISCSVIPHPPVNFSGSRKNNSSTLLEEYIDVLTWEPNSLNTGIQKYRIYVSIEGNRQLLAEVDAGTREFFHRKVEKDLVYSYAVRAVDSLGKEGEEASIDVQ